MFIFLQKRLFMKQNLQNLLLPWIKNIPNKKISNIVIDSRKTNIGDVFISINTNKTNRKKFIIEAIKNQVLAILYETNHLKKHGKWWYQNNTLVIFFFKLSEYISEISGRFYNHPGQYLDIIGVTGTNGKTTIIQLIAQWSAILGHKTATMGTLGNGLYKKLKYTKNTTSCPIYIQSFLNMAVKKK